MPGKDSAWGVPVCPVCLFICDLAGVLVKLPLFFYNVRRENCRTMLSSLWPLAPSPSPTHAPAWEELGIWVGKAKMHLILQLLKSKRLN